jgi:hypothetical protein
MPWTLHVDRAHHLAYIRMRESANFNDVAATQDALRANPDFEPTMPCLIDARGAHVQLNQQDMLALAERTPLRPGTRLAIVVDDPAELNQARNYEFIRALSFESEYARACNNLGEAIEWLGADGWRPPALSG